MLKSKMKSKPVRQIRCTQEDQQGDSLTVGKLYPVIYDSSAEAHGYIRVIDNSGEDFLYSSKFFVTADDDEQKSKKCVSQIFLHP